MLPRLDSCLLKKQKWLRGRNKCHEFDHHARQATGKCVCLKILRRKLSKVRKMFLLREVNVRRANASGPNQIGTSDSSVTEVRAGKIRK